MSNTCQHCQQATLHRTNQIPSMSGNSILKSFWRRVTKYGFILAMTIASLVACNTPLQHYISLTRYQHVGIAIFLFGMGYVMQTIWSWRVYSKWARLANIATFVFFCSVGLFFYMTPGLDGYATDPSPKKILVRLTHIFTYLFFALVVSLFWVKWAHEDNKIKDAEKAAAEKKVEGDSKNDTVAATVESDKTETIEDNSSKDNGTTSESKEKTN